MVFCNMNLAEFKEYYIPVTILILVDGFLQSKKEDKKQYNLLSHNPYFSRWFSAIEETRMGERCDKNVTILILVDGFLQ